MYLSILDYDINMLFFKGSEVSMSISEQKKK